MKYEAPHTAAVRATLHCLTGCAIGEVVGMIIGTAADLHSAATVAISVALAFAFGYGFSILPLLKAGLSISAALSVALAADTVSIFVMEVVDNAVMMIIPGAMGQGLGSIVFWLSLALSLAAAFVAALPVNMYLLKRGLGHSIAHKYHSHE